MRSIPVGEFFSFDQVHEIPILQLTGVLLSWRSASRRPRCMPLITAGLRQVQKGLMPDEAYEEVYC